MSVFIKICGITSAGDARQAVEAGADALGFNFFPRSPRYLEIEAVREIASKVPSNVAKVGVFVDSSAEQIAMAMRTAGLDIAQIHGPVPDGLNVRVWQALAAGSELRRSLESSQAEAFLIDTPADEQRGGTGRTFDWNLVAGLQARIVLAGGLGPDNVATALRQVKPWGVDACSRLESAPGRKDHAKVRAFIQAVRETGL